MFLNFGYIYILYFFVVIRFVFCELRREVSFWGLNFWVRDFNVLIFDIFFIIILLIGICI